MIPRLLPGRGRSSRQVTGAGVAEQHRQGAEGLSTLFLLAAPDHNFAPLWKRFSGSWFATEPVAMPRGVFLYEAQEEPLDMEYALACAREARCRAAAQP